MLALMADARLGVDDDVHAKAAEQRHSAAGIVGLDVPEQTLHVR